MAKNITVRLDDDVARWIRVHAAERETSVSQLLADMIRERMSAADEYERARRRWLHRAPFLASDPTVPYPKREDLHDRAGLR